MQTQPQPEAFNPKPDGGTSCSATASEIIQTSRNSHDIPGRPSSHVRWWPPAMIPGRWRLGLDWFLGFHRQHGLFFTLGVGVSEEFMSAPGQGLPSGRAHRLRILRGESHRVQYPCHTWSAHPQGCRESSRVSCAEYPGSTPM